MNLKLPVLLACIAATLPSTSDANLHDRAYILATQGGNVYWSVDPVEPEAPLADAIGCGPYVQNTATADQSKCLTYFDLSGATGEPRANRWGGTFWAMQMSRVNAPYSWNSAAPLKFRFQLEIAEVAAPTVHLVFSDRDQYLESAPAQEVAPGVFEGSIEEPGSIRPDSYAMFGVRVYAPAPHSEMRLATGGASWIGFPGGIDASSVTEMRTGEGPGEDIPLQLGRRSFSFNDDRFRVHAFEGDSDRGGTHALTLAAPAKAAIGWVETFRDAPLVDPVKTATQGHPVYGMSVSLRSGTGDIAHSPGTFFASGTEGFATLDLPAGSYTLDVASHGPMQSGAYRAFLLVLEGPRTLAGMRWPFHQFSAVRTPVLGSCEYGVQPVPVRPEVATWRADLSWVDGSHVSNDWTLNFYIPGIGDAPCGENGDSPWMRFVPTEPEVALIGATMANRKSAVSIADTNFQFEVDLTYLPG